MYRGQVNKKPINMDFNSLNNVKKALASRGPSFMINKMIEEMGEATQALSKYQNREFSDDSEEELLNKIEEELGHVSAFMLVMRQIFDPEEITSQRDKRIERFKKYYKKD